MPKFYWFFWWKEIIFMNSAVASMNCLLTSTFIFYKQRMTKVKERSVDMAVRFTLSGIPVLCR